MDLCGSRSGVFLNAWFSDFCPIGEVNLTLCPCVFRASFSTGNLSSDRLGKQDFLLRMLLVTFAFRDSMSECLLLNCFAWCSPDLNWHCFVLPFIGDSAALVFFTPILVDAELVFLIWEDFLLVTLDFVSGFLFAGLVVAVTGFIVDIRGSFVVPICDLCFAPGSDLRFPGSDLRQLAVITFDFTLVYFLLPLNGVCVFFLNVYILSLWRDINIVHALFRLSIYIVSYLNHKTPSAKQEAQGQQCSTESPWACSSSENLLPSLFPLRILILWPQQGHD